MNLQNIKSEISISDFAAVYAQQTVNLLNEEQVKLKIRRDEIVNSRLKNVTQVIDDIWSKSKYFAPYQVFFGNRKPIFELGIFNKNVENIHSEELEELWEELNSYKISLEYIATSNYYNGLFKVYFRFALPNGKPADNLFFELSGVLKLSDLEGDNFDEVTERLSKIEQELRKDWKQIYTNNIVALKMKEMGFDSNLSIPQLPTIELNSNLLN